MPATVTPGPLVLAGGNFSLTLSREGNSTTARLLPVEKVRKISDDNVLRHINILDGLFHRLVVLAENERDCRFYQAAIEHLEGQELCPSRRTTCCSSPPEFVRESARARGQCRQRCAHKRPVTTTRGTPAATCSLHRNHGIRLRTPSSAAPWNRTRLIGGSRHAIATPDAGAAAIA